MRSRAFLTLYAAVFAAAMGISMVGPLLPVYVKDLGATGIWVGLAFSSFAAVQVAAGPFVGRLSDRFGRKPFIVVGLLVYFAAALGYWSADTFYQVIAFRAFTGFGIVLFFSVARAYIGDLTPAGQEGRWLGAYATADFIGFGTGPVVAGVIREFFDFEALFLAMAFMMAASAVLVLTLLPARPASPRPHPAHGVPPLVVNIGIARALRNRLVVALTVFTAMQSMAGGATFAFLGIRLQDDLHVAPFLVGVAFAAQDVTGGLGQPIWGWVADRRNRRRMMVIGMLANSVALALLGMAPHYALALGCLVGAGITGSATQVAASAIQVVGGRRVGLGTLLGLNSAGNGIGIVAGSMIGGLLNDSFGLTAAFLFGALAMASGAVFFQILSRGIATTEPTLPAPRFADP